MKNFQQITFNQKYKQMKNFYLAYSRTGLIINWEAFEIQFRGWTGVYNIEVVLTFRKIEIRFGLIPGKELWQLNSTEQWSCQNFSCTAPKKIRSGMIWKILLWFDQIQIFWALFKFGVVDNFTGSSLVHLYIYCFLLFPCIQLIGSIVGFPWLPSYFSLDNHYDC